MSLLGKIKEDKVKRGIALIPFLTVGFPNIESTIESVLSLDKLGCTAVELGIPFSDPIAEGKVIQNSSKVALQNGVNISTCFEIVRDIRRNGASLPIVLMTYYNPILSYGEGNFLNTAKNSEVDGLILIDAPPTLVGTSYDFSMFSEKFAFIPLITVTSQDTTIKTVCKDLHGFVYCVTRTGVTGTHESSDKRFRGLVQKVKKYSEVPIAAGFGIANKASLKSLKSEVDAVVVGSAIIEVITETQPKFVAKQVSNFYSNLII